jgi:hypothetical protein
MVQDYDAGEMFRPLGLATAPTISYYAKVYPEAAWEAGGATGAVRRRLRCRRLCDATRLFFLTLFGRRRR